MPARTSSLSPRSSIVSRLATADVHSTLAGGLVKPDRLRDLYQQIEPELYRYPVIDPAAFRRELDQMLAAGH